MVFSRKNLTMLTDTKLRNIKSKDKLYKVNDRDGLYETIAPAGRFHSAITTRSTAGRRLSSEGHCLISACCHELRKFDHE